MQPTMLQKSRDKLPNPPRIVQRRQKYTRIGVVISVLAFGTLMTVGIALLGRELLYQWVRSHGQQITALVDSKEARVHYDHGSHLHYFLQYHFTFAGGEHTSEQQVPYSIYETINPPTQMSVRATQIGFWTIHAMSVQRVDSAWIPGLILCGITAAILLHAAISSARQRYLVREGTAVPGSVSDRRVRRGKNTGYCVKYRFTSKDGDIFERECIVSRKLFDTLAVGTAITVLHDPCNPMRSVAYECCPFEVVPAIGSKAFRL
jgi:hypothetical protein